ncbi:MAG: LysM peptidoglycan-binding domain-containing protein [Coxiellaceae bacterium]|nr:LysM peptidoglycan-binding domain-containing protein [Coxiellaceae bacterium]
MLLKARTRIKQGVTALVALLCVTITSSVFAFHLFSFHPARPSNLWQAMKSHFGLLPSRYPTALSGEIIWFEHNHYYINELVDNAGPYLYYIYEQTQLRHMPAEIALIPMVESGFNPFVYSRKGATGLWQMMPGTASGFGLSINWWYDGRRDIVASTKAALDYLDYLHNFFNNDWLLAIAAYDSGEGTVQRALRFNKKHHRSTDFWSLPLPHETRDYVPKLLALSAILSTPGHYNVPVAAIPNHAYFAKIDMQSQIGIAQAAKLAGVDKQVMRELNPGFRRWATLPDEPYSLLLPRDKLPTFKQGLSEIADSDRVTWQHHTVLNGETLSEIALHYHTKAATLRQVNNMASSRIRVKQSLLVPLTMSGKFDQLDIDLQHGAIAEDKLPGPRRKMHHVKSNDSMWTIASRYGVTVSELEFWNGLSYNTKLHKNDKLIIWLPHRSDPRVRYKHYKVKSGDSLSRIAVKYHTSSKALRNTNHLKTNAIRIGQSLTIPVKPHHHKHHA